MIQKALLAIWVFSLLSGWAGAQQENPKRPPTSIPQPKIPTDLYITITGKIITDTPRQPDWTIQVRLEGISRELVAVAHTNGNGDFVFRGVKVERNQIYYLVVEEEGFEPIRQDLRERIELTRGGNVTLFLRTNPVTVGQQRKGDGFSNVVNYRQLQAEIPKKATEEYEKALKESSKGNYSKVIEHLEKALDLAPDFLEAHNKLGVQYAGLGRFQDAENSFTRTRELDPNGSRPLINLGSLYFQQGQMQSDAGQTEEAQDNFQKAADLLEEALRLQPLSATASYFLGATLYKIGSYERAESMLHRALELDEEMDDVRLMLLNVYTKQQRYDAAMEQLMSYLQKNPESPRRAALESLKEQIERALNR